jgi:hypothetical protein
MPADDSKSNWYSFPEDPNRAAFAVISPYSHPDWYSQKIIHVPVWPDFPGSTLQHNYDTIPVFVKPSCQSGIRTYKFGFDGWYHVSHVSYLEPQSEELKAVLSRRFPLRHFFNVRPSVSPRSLKKKWASITLELDQNTAKDPPNVEALVEGDNGDDAAR